MTGATVIESDKKTTTALCAADAGIYTRRYRATVRFSGDMRRMARIWTGRVNVTGRSCRRSLPRQSESTAGTGRPCVDQFG